MKAILLIISIHLFAISPFSIDVAAYLLGWKLGANTSFQNYSSITTNIFSYGEFVKNPFPFTYIWDLMTFKYYETRVATIQRYLFFSLNQKS